MSLPCGPNIAEYMQGTSYKSISTFNRELHRDNLSAESATCVVAEPPEQAYVVQISKSRVQT